MDGVFQHVGASQPQDNSSAQCQAKPPVIVDGRRYRGMQFAISQKMSRTPQFPGDRNKLTALRIKEDLQRHTEFRSRVLKIASISHVDSVEFTTYHVMTCTTS